MNQTKAQKGLANSLSKRYAVTLLIHAFPTILKLLTAKRLIQTPFDAGHLTLLVLQKSKNSIEVSIFRKDFSVPSRCYVKGPSLRSGLAWIFVSCEYLCSNKMLLERTLQNIKKAPNWYDKFYSNQYYSNKNTKGNAVKQFLSISFEGLHLLRMI